MNHFLPLALSLALAPLAVQPVLGQDQQAGDEASTNTEDTFQALIEQCDDTDALMLRARIRLQLPRTTPEAAETAQKMLDEGFATCGGGDLDGAKATLTEALAIAEAGATENFGTDATVDDDDNSADASDAAEDESEAKTGEASDETNTDDKTKPWWKFW